jgi:hypothetical protein
MCCYTSVSANACACVARVHMYINVCVHAVHAHVHLYIHNSHSLSLAHSLALCLAYERARFLSLSLSAFLPHPTLFLSPIIKPKEKASKANKSIIGPTSILFLFSRVLSRVLLVTSSCFHVATTREFDAGISVGRQKPNPFSLRILRQWMPRRLTRL